MGRGLIVIAVACLLASCGRGDDGAPFAESRTPPALAARFYPPEGWGWGFIQVGDGPAQRYGVAAPTGVPRAQILILPDYGETAETWFETANDLTARGYGVWVLEGVGQGGSGRLAAPRDLGHVASFDPDVAAVKAMARVVIRPETRAPLILLGQGTGAIVAARAAETGLVPAGLILSAPAWRARAPATVPSWFGPQRVAGGHGWRRDGSDAFNAGLTHDPWRGAVTYAWQLANPDLRLGAPSTAWQGAYATAATLARQNLARIEAPTLTLAPAEDRPPGGAVRIDDAHRALELERDTPRDAWLSAIAAFIETHRAHS